MNMYSAIIIIEKYIRKTAHDSIFLQGEGNLKLPTVPTLPF